MAELSASSSNTGKNIANLNQMVFTETTRQRELKSLEEYSALLMSEFFHSPELIRFLIIILNFAHIYEFLRKKIHYFTVNHILRVFITEIFYH